MGKPIIWTKEMDDFLIREFSDNSNSELAEALELDRDAIWRRGRKLGLKKNSMKTIPEGHKWCNHCKQALTFDKFSANRSKPQGLDTYCKKCVNETRLAKKEEKKSDAFKQQKKTEEEAKLKTSTDIIKCTVCGKEKLGEEFSFLKKTLKREARCKKCKQEENQKYRIQKIIKGESW